MTTYKSKVGLELIIPISIIVGGTGILMAYEKVRLGLAIVLLVVAFIVHMFGTTYYHVDNSTLKIRCGYFFNKQIDIDTIKEIKDDEQYETPPPATDIVFMANTRL